MYPTASLTQKYDVPVPRYTSYPTAPHFTSQYTASTYAQQLGELCGDVPISVYVHMPFCKSLCWYCGCNMRVAHKMPAIREYANTICREVEIAAVASGKRLTVGNIHFGGGTPTWGPREGLAAIIEALRKNFDVRADAEIAMEIDPRTLTPELSKYLAALGVNRVSLGVQDFDPTVQIAINRYQPFDQVRLGVEDLRAVGIEHINIDLIYGLPLQTREKIIRTMDMAIALTPQRVALFGYAHVPWMKKHQRLLEKNPIPDSGQRFELFAAAQARIKSYGFEQIGIDHFAHPNDNLAQALRAHTLHRNFQGYTTDAAPVLLGFGTSAISSLRQAYAQNETDVAKYMGIVAAGTLPTVRGRTLTDDDLRRRALITDLMCYFSACIPEDLGRQCAPTLSELEGDGLITWREPGMLHMTEQGRPWVRVVAACFDTYFQPAPARHARAV